MDIINRLGSISVCVLVGVLAGVGSAVLLPVSLPVAVVLGVASTGVCAGVNALGEFTHELIARKKRNDGFPTEHLEKMDALLAREASMLRKEYERIHKLQMESQEKIERTVNSNAEENKSLLISIVAKVDSLEKENDSKKSNQQDNPKSPTIFAIKKTTSTVDAKKKAPGKASDALAHHGLYSVSNHKDFDSANNNKIDAKKPERKTLRV